ncbi:hypothetical protein Ae168Ps1_6391c [Pseudonocardia sp. Ae168_Ps1]|uniref:DUF5047 domain-containing protein n=1 Tax=unclassified Pseudonocardia TaxID=2619320 RepID=UPI00094AACA8|nr:MULTISPECIES: DUF5047 domain-containing protein [unclassified Pseudonocardia]OLL69834.1 hypothetical protein Ae150APs1_6245c [Pseudonocardia sp. Ae150A_Ps1]OLL69966.1 hypothetical protein Ae168Ps1_6391c [Pseudonocardia sp. Ae168_Ps1]OLL89127.1 hypothetical protein Ae356Ps1_6244c [Pseudonocardia sp. Ae356_Ps1]
MARPTSTRLREIVRSSHSARARATLIAVPHRFSQSLTPSGEPLALLGGDVRMDSSALVRSTLDITVAARWGWIVPNGSEIFVEYGVEVAGGVFEWTALGYFRVETVTQEERGVVRISGSDRMAQVADTEALWPWVAPRTATHQEFFSALLYGSQASWFHRHAGAFPSKVDDRDRVIIADYPLARTRLRSQTLLEEPFAEHITGLARRYGKRAFFDYRGRLTLVSDDVDAADPALVPVRTITAGAGGGLQRLRRQISRDGVYTCARVSGEQATEAPPPWAAKTVDGAGGSLRGQRGLSWYGEFGRILKRHSSPLLRTTAQCEAAAETWVNRIRGLPSALSFQIPADPTLEPLDLIAVRFPEQRPGDGYPPPPGMRDRVVVERHVIDTLTFPLTGGDMAVSTRGARVQAYVAPDEGGRRP